MRTYAIVVHFQPRQVFLNHFMGTNILFWNYQGIRPKRKQGSHKSGKHGKPGKLREFEKLSKYQGKLREI